MSRVFKLPNCSWFYLDYVSKFLKLNPLWPYLSTDDVFVSFDRDTEREGKSRLIEFPLNNVPNGFGSLLSGDMIWAVSTTDGTSCEMSNGVQVLPFGSINTVLSLQLIWSLLEVLHYPFHRTVFLEKRVILTIIVRFS